jgi:hypothetical protein
MITTRHDEVETIGQIETTGSRRSLFMSRRGVEVEGKPAYS